MNVRNWQTEVADLARDLFHLETNTILSEGIIGRKMPSYPHALLDVAGRYLDFMQVRFGLDLKDYWTIGIERRPRGKEETLEEAVAREERNRRALKHAEVQGKQPIFAKEPRPLGRFALTNGVESFLRLHYAAGYLLNNLDKSRETGFTVEDRWVTIVLRIKRNCDALISIIEEFERIEVSENLREEDSFLGRTRRDLTAMIDMPPRPPTELIVRLRKIWDIGTDVIVMQTVLQLDGDVMNRVKRDFDLAHNQPLWSAHQRCMEMSIEHWQKMFDVLVRLLETAFKNLLGR